MKIVITEGNEEVVTKILESLRTAYSIIKTGDNYVIETLGDKKEEYKPNLRDTGL